MKIDTILKSNKFILVKFKYKSDNYKLFIDEENLQNLNNAFKQKTISSFFKYLSKHNVDYDNIRYKEVNFKYLKNKINLIGVKYSFIGDLLIKVYYQNNTYFFDLLNDTIEKIKEKKKSKKKSNKNDYHLNQFIELDETESHKFKKTEFNNFTEMESSVMEEEQFQKKINNRTNKSKYNDSTNKYNDSTNKYNDSTEEQNETTILKDKIKEENILDSKFIPEDLRKLLNFSLNNKEFLKPLLGALNLGDNSLISSLVGTNLEKENVTEPKKIISEISKNLKILEDLNNDDLCKLKENEFEKFNFIISEIWNQIKKIIFSLNKLSANDNYDKMLEKYKGILDEIIYDKNKIYIDLNITANETINYIFSKLIKSYNNLMESKLLELNILLQNYNPNNNSLVDSKMNIILNDNYYIFETFFSEIYSRNDFTNLFSDFNKHISLNNLLTNISNEAKEFMVKKVNNFQNESNNKIDIIREMNKQNIVEDIKEIISIDKFKSNSVDYEIYNNYKSIIDLEFNNYISFNENIIKKHNMKKILKRKQMVSDLLIKLHEEIQFKLNIILKVCN